MQGAEWVEWVALPKVNLNATLNGSTEPWTKATLFLCALRFWRTFAESEPFPIAMGLSFVPPGLDHPFRGTGPRGPR